MIMIYDRLWLISMIMILIMILIGYDYDYDYQYFDATVICATQLSA